MCGLVHHKYWVPLPIPSRLSALRCRVPHLPSAASCSQEKRAGPVNPTCSETMRTHSQSHVVLPHAFTAGGALLQGLPGVLPPTPAPLPASMSRPARPAMIPLRTLLHIRAVATYSASTDRDSTTPATAARLVLRKQIMMLRTALMPQIPAQKQSQPRSQP